MVAGQGQLQLPIYTHEFVIRVSCNTSTPVRCGRTRANRQRNQPEPVRRASLDQTTGSA